MKNKFIKKLEEYLNSEKPSPGKFNDLWLTLKREISKMVVEHQHIVKRTIYVAQCGCDINDPYRRVVESNPPRETKCPLCGNWLAFHEESVSAPEYGQRKFLTE